MLTLEQWLDIWRKQYLSNVKPGTVCHYESVCRLHIVPALGNTPLVKLRTPAIQKFYIDLQKKVKSKVHQEHSRLPPQGSRYSCAD